MSRYPREESIHCICGWVGQGYGNDPCPRCGSRERTTGDVDVDAFRRATKLVNPITTHDPGKEPIESLIKRSSIGAALDDIKERGIDAHLVDLEQELADLENALGAAHSAIRSALTNRSHHERP